MKTLHQNIKIPALKGKATIVRSDLFSYIDSDFKNYGTDVIGEKTKSIKLAVCEMDKDSTFAQIFINPEKMCLSQEQILYFVKNEKDKLRTDGYATFFLFKVGSEFFVAHVLVFSGGLRVLVYRFSHDYVWRADLRLRVVVPQLALENSELSTSETLSLEKAIEVCKQNGLEVIKKM